ncbi:MAG: cell division protein FtsA [Ardenticatenia bacterium]|nr:cell division protein FtsA [Ardenticatenia bacterium]
MRHVVGLDIGSSKIACLVGEVDDHGRLRIIGIGVVPSAGIRKGAIVDLEAATRAVEAAVTRAEHTSGLPFHSALVGMAGAHIVSLNSRGTISISRGSHTVQQDDVQRVLEAARAIALPHSHEIVHLIPRGFWLDSENGVRNPVGLHGYRLEVEAHVVAASTTALQTLETCCRGAGVEVQAFVLDPLAAGEAVLTEDEKELGVVLVDVGGGTTDIAIFIEGAAWHTVSLPVGGHHLSHDLAVGLQCPLPVAEELKVRHGCAATSLVTANEPVDVATFGDMPSNAVTRHDIAEILQYRVLDLFDLVRREIKRSGYDGLLPAGVVFCGGSAQLEGLRELAIEYFQLPVRVGQPHTARLSGLIDTLGSPAFAATVGLLRWGAHHHQVREHQNGTGHSSSDWKERLTRWLTTLLPE